MKRNSKKAATQKPKIGEFYKIWENDGLTVGNVMKIHYVGYNIALYTLVNGVVYEQRWDFMKFPEILDQKLTSLEMELM